MCVHIAQKKHELKEEDACRPYIGSAAEVGKKHFANHRLAHEKEKGAEEEGYGKDADSQIQDPREKF